MAIANGAFRTPPVVANLLIINILVFLAEILLPGYDNLMFDLASVLEYITPEHAERMIGKFGSDRIMFGSDYPVTSIDDEIKMFMRLNLTEKERDNILWNNAARFYGLE